ncbi:ATP-binding protein [Luteimonas sp. gir]|uniref:ATP-binding protein n=1 Tax=Luteimonas sp. gir TaxID=3127960 RepID=UPI003075C199
MTRASGLRSQIATSLAVMSLGLMVLSFVGSYAFYAWASAYAPSMLSQSWVPSGAELAWIVTTVVAAVVISVWVAIRLSRRILNPLNAAAHGLRDIAQGNLHIRVALDARATGETAQLAQDVNALAERLQDAMREQTFWNAAVAHELRTPVTILRGRLQGLVDGVFAPEPAVFAGLLKQAESLSRLVEDLRVLSLQDSGHFEIDLVAVDLAQELHGVAESVSDRLAAAGFDLRVETSVPPRVTCDPARIRQALTALLDNALKHATPGPLLLYGRVADDEACVGVVDSGPGVPEALRQHVFDAFRRGDPSRSRAGGGSGLGLAVVRTIAIAHGGHAGCRSALGCGSDVFLAWPVTDARQTRVDGRLPPPALAGDAQ